MIAPFSVSNTADKEREAGDIRPLILFKLRWWAVNLQLLICHLKYALIGIQVLHAKCYICSKLELQQSSKEFNFFSGRLSSIACKLYLPLFLEIKLTPIGGDYVEFSYCAAILRPYWVKRVILRSKFSVCMHLYRRRSDVSIVCRHLTM